MGGSRIVQKNFMITPVDYVFNWDGSRRFWPMTFGLACCAIEMIRLLDGAF